MEIKPKVLNKQKEAVLKDAVYIGRGSKWGNPFVIGRDGDRKEVCEKYEQYASEKFSWEKIQEELKGKDLVCFCAPQRCHGDYLLQRANTVTIFDLITGDVNNRYTINIRGTNATGKTSLARSFIDEDSREIFLDGMKNPAFVYCSSSNVLLLGSYRNKCGGCDTLVKKDTVRLLKLAWLTDCNIIFEGVIVGDNKEVDYWYMRELNETIAKRFWGFAYLLLPFEECLRRVYSRNNNKPVKEDLMEAKWKSSFRYRDWQEQQRDCIVISLDAIKSKEAVRKDFDNIIEFVKKGDKIVRVEKESYLVEF